MLIILSDNHRQIDRVCTFNTQTLCKIYQQSPITTALIVYFKGKRTKPLRPSLQYYADTKTKRVPVPNAQDQSRMVVIRTYRSAQADMRVRCSSPTSFRGPNLSRPFHSCPPLMVSFDALYTPAPNREDASKIRSLLWPPCEA